MTKILFLGRFFPVVHGASMMNEYYYKELQKEKDIDIRRIRINYSNTLDELGKVNFKKFLGIMIVFFQTLYQLIIFRPDVVYFEIAIKGFAFYRDSVYGLLCKLFRRKIVFHFHGKGVVQNGYSKFLFKNTKVIILSPLLYDEVKDLIDEKNVVFCPNGIEDELNDDLFKEIINARLENKTLNLLYLSNMIESKGYLEVLEICNLLNKFKIDFKCFFVGSFDNVSMEQCFLDKIKSLNLDKRCFYLGSKYGKDKSKILKKTNYLIFPTTYSYEAFPLVILEAFMYGIPVLSYDNGAIKEMINKDYLGYASKCDVDFLFKELMFRKDIGEQPQMIRNNFLQNYTIDKAVKKIREILR